MAVTEKKEGKREYWWVPVSRAVKEKYTKEAGRRLMRGEAGWTGNKVAAETLTRHAPK